ncbi:MAG: DNA repair protein RadA [Bacteroidales bacterium]|nr:DNA repair protein RadA [Bacteroidales bacterium]MEE3407307.1 DNA repair protein RadA [Candidatus Cryptobacteroides sp.]MBP5234607.1 DNA repair protein RadA [Bacteroidales bacterium]MBP5741530.1 DNA repair protein RadA [Bacteroidales bacterium]MBQ2109074.1 DNA repair protein RadA [Bacteroidales bacterium]
MATNSKEKTVWFCTSCGNESPKWLGRCPACGEWNTMVEKTVATGKPKKNAAAASRAGGHKPQSLSEIGSARESRISLGDQEIDRLLGGGLVEGSLVLIGGEPGIGKSTLSLQLPLRCPSLKTLYVSGEESARQVKMRAERLGGDAANCFIYSETLIENVVAEALEMQPDLMVVDSVQTMYSETVESSAGSVAQIKEVTSILLHFAKSSGIPVILIGHITKDGYIAGPKILEHIVDVVLQFEGDDKGSYRLLRSIKNRFGSTSELAVFEMTGAGLRPVTNPSEMLMPMHEQGLSGTAVAVMVDGARPFLFEVQALVSTAAYGTAQRSATGYDSRRLNMLLAVLEKRAGFKLTMKDVFLNMAGGLRVADPACDLAVVCAVLSSNFDFALPSDICFAGEVGLSGEIRPVNQVDRRITEAARLGFRKIYVSKYASFDKKAAEGVEVVKVADIPALVRSVFKG